MQEIYSRQIALPEIGQKGQRRLKESSILVIGLGGLGCASLPYLAASGIGRIGLMDFDCVEPSNLPRQTLYGESDIGQLKADVAFVKLQGQYPKTRFEKHALRIEEVKNLSDYDLILDATDNSSARYAINDFCCLTKKPWVYGSIHEWQGHAAFFVPPDSDYRTFFPDAISNPLPTCSLGGVLGPLAGCIGSIQALEAIKFLASGISSLSGKLLVLNAMTWQFQVFHFSHPTRDARSAKYAS